MDKILISEKECKNAHEIILKIKLCMLNVNNFFFSEKKKNGLLFLEEKLI